AFGDEKGLEGVEDTLAGAGRTTHGSMLTTGAADPVTIPAGRYRNDLDRRDLPRRRGRPESRLAWLGRTGRAHAPRAARIGRQHGAQLRPARDRPRPRALERTATLDHRRVPPRAGRAPRDHGNPRRPI